MNWRKLFKYTVIISIVLTIIGMFWMNRQGTLMYGGLTKVVDYKQFEPQTGSIALKNANILSEDGENFVSGQTLLIENGLITAIDSTLALSSNTLVIDGTGKYLIPGLIDTHVHLFQSQNDLLLYIANGVTEIRELIGEENHLEWKQQIENGRIGPKMFVASPRVGSFGTREGWFMSYTQGYLNVKNAEEAKTKIKNLYEKGYDGIKIYSQINKESYLEVTKTAQSLGMPVLGHIPWELELSEVWQNGQSGIAHFEEVMNALGREFNKDRNIGGFKGHEEKFLDFIEERSSTVADNLIKNDIAVTSTLWLTESFAKQPFNLEQVLREVELEYENPGISEWVPFIPQGLGWLPDVNRYKLPENQTEDARKKSELYWKTYVRACQLLAHNFAEKGVKIMAGTDANLPPTVPGFSLHDELGSLNRAGMSNSQVLRSATNIPAEWLKSNAGKVMIGYEANLVLLERNPLENIKNTKTINTVIAKGQVFDRPLLDNMLAAVKEANDASRKIDISEYGNR